MLNSLIRELDVHAHYVASYDFGINYYKGPAVQVPITSVPLDEDDFQEF